MVPPARWHSPTPPRRWSKRLAPEGAVVLGNSVGGFSAARLALRRPELVRGLVLVDAGGFMAPSPRVRAFCALMSRPWFLRRIYPRFAARYMRPRTEADRRALAAAVATTREDPGLRAVCELWASFARPRARPARRGRPDRGSDPGRLGPPRPGDPGAGGEEGSVLDPGRAAGRPRRRPRPPHDRSRGLRCGADPVRRRRLHDRDQLAGRSISRLRILPVGPFGRSSRNQTARGYL